MNEQQQRREYADLVEARRKMEHDIAKQNGQLPPRGAKFKNGILSFLLGLFISDWFH